MANTYTRIYIHAVFAVRYRQHLISAHFKNDLQKYMTGVISDHGWKLIAINNMPDHFHLLVGMKPDLALSDVLGDVKSASSRLINDKRWVRGKFEWQEGYGAFSYAHSQLSDVIRYIENQQEHHRTRSFQEEYVALLEEFEEPFDKRYIFKPVE